MSEGSNMSSCIGVAEVLENTIDLTKIEHLADIMERIPYKTIKFLRSNPDNEQVIKYYTNVVLAQNPYSEFVDVEKGEACTREQLEDEARKYLNHFMSQLQLESLVEIHEEFENEENRLMDIVKNIEQLENETLHTFKKAKILEVGINAHLGKIHNEKVELTNSLNVNIDQCNQALTCYNNELQEIRLKTTGQERTKMTRHVQEVQGKMQHYHLRSSEFEQQLKRIIVGRRIPPEPSTREPTLRESSKVIGLVEEKMRDYDVIRKDIELEFSDYKTDFLKEFYETLLGDIFGLLAREHAHCMRLIDLDKMIRTHQTEKAAEKFDMGVACSISQAYYERTKVVLAELDDIRVHFNLYQMESCQMFVAQINRISRIAAGQSGTGPSSRR